MTGASEERRVRDLVRDPAAPLTAVQRVLLAELLDEIAIGVRVEASVVAECPGEPGTHRLTAASCWRDVVARYRALLASGAAS